VAARLHIESLVRRHRWIPVLALVAAVVTVYANGLAGGFVWDDELVVVKDPATRSLRSALDLFLAPDVVKPYYRPLTRLSFVIDHAVFGMRPLGFHLVNLALHVANVVVLHGLLLSLFSAPGLAFAAALLFGIHPVNAESVDFVSARNNLLALLFVLLSLRQFATALSTRSGWRALSAGVLWMAALLSKESAGAAILLFPALALRGRREVPAPWGRAMRAAVPLILGTGAYLALRTVALRGGSPAEGLSLAPPAAVVATNLETIPRYLRLFFWPDGLNIFHELTGVGGPGNAWIWVAWAAILGGVAWIAVRPSAPSGAGLAWLVVSFLPIANLVPIPSAPMAERYLYLPMAGLCLVAADRARMAWRAAGSRVSVALAMALAFPALAGVTVRRNLDWRDDLALFGSSVEANPTSARALYNFGVACADAGDMANATWAWESALELDPEHDGAMAQLATLAARGGDLARAELLYRKALSIAPGAVVVHYNLGRLLESTGRFPEALAEYDAFLRGAGPEYRHLVAKAMEARVRVMSRVPGGSEPRGPAPP
jgi:hypothetical protein